MKKIILVLFAIVIIIGIYFYATRPVTAPTAQETAEAVTEQLPIVTQTNNSTYHIDGTQSKASFSIDEELRGKPFTAIGTTSDIAGDIRIEGDTITFGTITIGAKTFKTDSGNRDGAINRFILKTETTGNEYIYFKPTTVDKTLTEIKTGIKFNISGDLIIAGKTKSETFEASLSVTDNKITGEARGIIKRSDYGLTIPSIPFVAKVPDEFEIIATIIAPIKK